MARWYLVTFLVVFGTNRAEIHGADADKDAAIVWKEYCEAAPRLSMSMGYAFGRPTEQGALAPADARIRQALEQHETSQRLLDYGSKRSAGLKMNQAEREAFEKDLKRLGKKALEAISDDAAGEESIWLGFKMFVNLQRQSIEGMQIWRQGREIQWKSWQSLAPIYTSRAGPAAATPPLAFDLHIGPGRERTVTAFNLTRKDLHNVTLRVQTNLSFTLQGAIRESFVFIPVWRKNDPVTFSSMVASKLIDVYPPPPIVNGMGYSIWCEELACEDVKLHLPLQRPRQVYRFVPEMPPKVQEAKPITAEDRKKQEAEKREREAAGHLEYANVLFKENRKQEGMDRLNFIVRMYSETEAATSATSMIKNRSR